MKEVYFIKDRKDLDILIGKIDFSKLGSDVAIKVHFGEKGCTTYIDPQIVRRIYEKIISLGKKATLIECNVLYKGERTSAKSHIRVAKEHGFDFAPIDILDGETGEEYLEVKLKKGVANPVKIGKGLQKYDSLIVLTHFKGHMFSGFGGSLKNIGMGLGSRAGKLHMHASVKPSVNQSICTGCATCIEHCNAKAIVLKNNKAKIDPKKCEGCAMCIAVCPNESVEIPWGSETSDGLQKKIVDYADGVISQFKKESILYISVLENITVECDCMDIAQKPMMEDVGILLSYDIVSIDKASLDLVAKYSNNRFETINRVNKNTQINYAFEKGLGDKEYKLIELK
jgi:uncharacterized protein